MEPRTQNNKGEPTGAGQEKSLGIYTGSVSAAGVLSNGPADWEAGAPSSSVFTVTHNLGLTADGYTVHATVTGASAGVAMVTTKGANAFTVTTSDLATPSVADRAFDFILIKE